MNYPAPVSEVKAARDIQAAYLSSWNLSNSKRAFDLFVTVPLLVTLLPVMIIIGLAIKLCSAGPVLYRQRRVGQRGREFQVMKFRTMRHAPQQPGLRLTSAGDSRVTRLGRVLRKWKLDELPQLFNVLGGEMSLVGPRPDVSEFISLLDERQRRILLLRPGITGWASLHYRNEEEVLSRVPKGEFKQFYCTRILPEKVQLDLDYAARASITGDIAVLLRTALAVSKGE